MPTPISTARTTIISVYDAWFARDVDCVLLHAADDIRYTVHLPPGSFPTAGSHTGKAEVRSRLEQLIQSFDLLTLVFDDITMENGDENCGAARSVLLFHFRHKLTGFALESRCRHVWRIEGGLVSSLEEFHDAGRLEAFMKMVKDS